MRVIETEGRGSRRVFGTRLGRTFAVPVPNSNWNRPPADAVQVDRIQATGDDRWRVPIQSHCENATMKRPQIGISIMLMLVLIFALMSAAMVYAAQIPEVQEDWAMLWGTTPPVSTAGRGPQIVFILFTITSPLLLAMLMSAFMAIWKVIAKP